MKHAQRAIAEKTRIKAEERRKVVEQRCGKPKDLNGLSDGKLLYWFIFNSKIIVLFSRSIARSLQRVSRKNQENRERKMGYGESR